MISAFRAEFIVDFYSYLKNLRQDLNITLYPEGHEPHNRPYIYIIYKNIRFAIEVDDTRLFIIRTNKMLFNPGYELICECFENPLSSPSLYEDTAQFILAETIWSNT